MKLKKNVFFLLLLEMNDNALWIFVENVRRLHQRLCNQKQNYPFHRIILSFLKIILSYPSTKQNIIFVLQNFFKEQNYYLEPI